MSSEDRLREMGLGHLVDDPAALAAALKARGEKLHARQSAWDLEQARWLAEQEALAAQEDAARGVTRRPVSAGKGPTPSASFFSAGEAAPPPLTVPDSLASIRTAWSFLGDAAIWPHDVPREVLAAFNHLRQLADAIVMKEQAPSRGEREALLAAHGKLKQSLGARRPKNESAIAVLLRVCDAILAGHISRR